MKKQERNAENKEAAYYDLHTGAVDDLVTATKDNTPRYSEEELNRYRSGKKRWRFPQGLKAALIKFWFYGAVCYFVFWGLGLYLVGLDLYFVAGIVLGMVTDLLINHFLRFTEKLPGGSRKWMMVTRRGAVGFVLNVLYGFLLIFLVITAYNVINSGIVMIFGQENAPLLHVEPLCFGLITMGADTLCVTVRNTFAQMLADAKRK